MKVLVGATVVVILAFAAGYPSSRIIDGTLPGKAIPYVVSIQSDDTHICGGFIYNDKWVITAASCVKNKVLTSLKVSINDYKFISNNDPAETKVNVYKVIINEGYNNATKVNDIALVELAQTLPLVPLLNNTDGLEPSKLVGPSCVRYDEITGIVAGNVSGWGLIEVNGGNVTTLHTGYVETTLSETCTTHFGTNFTASTMICANNMPNPDAADPTSAPVTAPCTYDEGSPLIITVDEEPIAVGVFSYNDKCNTESPSVFTRVSVFYAWIAKNAGPEPADCYSNQTDSANP